MTCTLLRGTQTSSYVKKQIPACIRRVQFIKDEQTGQKNHKETVIGKIDKATGERVSSGPHGHPGIHPSKAKGNPKTVPQDETAS